MIKDLVIGRPKPPINLEPFIKTLEAVAKEFSWRLDDFDNIRCTIGGVTCCLVQAVGYIQSGSSEKDRVIPSSANLGLVTGDDRVAAAIVHIADNIVSSRYYDAAIRDRILKTCGLLRRKHKFDSLPVVVVEGAEVTGED
jgi:hypothetical protein